MASISEPSNDATDPPPLESTFEALVQECGRIRLLVVGKTGVGKTSLIKKTFKVDHLSASDIHRGQSDISTEIFTESNPYFVVHDSQGYEPGDTSIFGQLQVFLKDRINRVTVAERVHIVWLCIAVPYAGGRVLETGTEKILQLCRERGLPLIVVFTKYDELVAVRQLDLLNEIGDTDIDAIDETLLTERAESAAAVQYQELCCQPLDAYMRSVPCVKVSTQSPYDDTLTKLVEVTEAQITESLPPLLMATAQRVNFDDKIRTSVIIGKKKYWRGLASSIYFPGYSLQGCLRVLHKDIVKPWNFNDPNELLLGDGFVADISRLVDGTLLDGNPRWNRVLKGAGLAGPISGVVGAATGPLAPILAPVVFAAVFLAAWVYETYQASNRHVEMLMGYIVHLILVLQRLSKEYDDSLSQPFIDKAISQWNEHADKVQNEIKVFTRNGRLESSWNRDNVIDKIQELIEAHKLK